jgi:hypothetical protein
VSRAIIDVTSAPGYVNAAMTKTRRAVAISDPRFKTK